MGGRGSAGGREPRGRSISIKTFFENLDRNDKDGMIRALSHANLDIRKASFTTNGNTIRAQEAILERGNDRVSLRFFNGYDPMQIAKPKEKITQQIEAVVWKNGHAAAIRTLAEAKSMSLKNAKRNYEEMLEKWKSITKQRTIKFK